MRLSAGPAPTVATRGGLRAGFRHCLTASATGASNRCLDAVRAVARMTSFQKCRSRPLSPLSKIRHVECRSTSGSPVRLPGRRQPKEVDSCETVLCAVLDDGAQDELARREPGIRLVVRNLRQVVTAVVPQPEMPGHGSTVELEEVDGDIAMRRCSPRDAGVELTGDGAAGDGGSRLAFPAALLEVEERFEGFRIRLVNAAQADVILFRRPAEPAFQIATETCVAGKRDGVRALREVDVQVRTLWLVARNPTRSPWGTRRGRPAPAAPRSAPPCGTRGISMRSPPWDLAEGSPEGGDGLLPGASFFTDDVESARVDVRGSSESADPETRPPALSIRPAAGQP